MGRLPRCQNAVMVMPSSMVKDGRTVRPVLLLTASLICSTVASWPVVRTEAIEMVRGLDEVRAAATAIPLAHTPAATAQCHRGQRRVTGARRTVAAAATADGISIAR